jgi:hypothetical protein
MGDQSKKEKRRADLARQFREPRPTAPELPRCHCGELATLHLSARSGHWFYCAAHADQADRLPERRRRATAGPIPTLSQLRAQSGWLWAQCPIPCAHAAAIPLDPIVARMGASASSDRLRRRLVCTVCGSRGAELTLPSWVDVNQGSAKLPLDRVPAWLTRAMTTDALRTIGVVH